MLRLGLMASLVLLAIAGQASAKQLEATDDLAVTQPAQAVLVDVLANDTQLGGGLRILSVNKADHGITGIENGRIRYVPKAGFQGSDSFRYKVQAAKSKPAEATVNVEVGASGVALRLVGQVVDEPVPGATVTASIGGFNFVGHADATGHYVLDIAALRGDAFVTLAATGVSPSGADVRFYSVVGEIARLASAAGSDGVLVRDELNQVNVTNLSTAQYLLLTDANDGVPVGSDQQLLPLTQNINLDQLLELAAIIKLVVDDNVPLPAGVTDALALVSDPAATETFKEALAPGQLATAIESVAADTSITPEFRAGALPTGYATISPSAPGTIRVGISSGVLYHFDGTAAGTSGTATVIDASPGSTPPATWQLVNGELVITPAASYTTDPYEDFPVPPQCVATDYYQVRDTELQTRLIRLQDGPGMDYLKIVTTAIRQYEDFNPGDGCVPPADGPVDYTYVRLAFEDGAGEIPFTSNEALGQIALSHLQPGVFPGFTDNHTWASAIHDFNTGTVAIPGTQPGFTYNVSNGRLHVQLTNASTLETTDYEHRRYQLDGALGEGIFTIATQPDGNPVSTYELASRVSGATFDSLAMPARWRSGFDVSQFQGDGSLPFGFSLILNGDAAQTGYYESVDLDGVASPSNYFTWSVEGGGMVYRSYRNPPYGSQPSCSVPVPGANCWLRRLRTWTPLSFTPDGNRVYVLERIYDRQGPALPLNLIAERINFFNRE
ncbi:Ig-like domain-containing protein [Lysobacter fragariae]